MSDLFEALLQSVVFLRDSMSTAGSVDESSVTDVVLTSQRNSSCNVTSTQSDMCVSIEERPSPFKLYTAHPVAISSHDHIFPLGTAQDNTHYPRFIARCEEILGKGLNVLDLGCAGGGLVLDFLSRGHEAFGLEGSDYPKTHQLFEWSRLSDRLHTCDITKPFMITDPSRFRASFDVISMWEVLEHIQESSLSQLLSNIRDHLSPRGIFCASVATFECADQATGAVWHVTVKPRQWWIDKLQAAGLEVLEGLFTVKDFPRGSGNGPQDWDALREPHMGFHVVARRRG